MRLLRWLWACFLAYRFYYKRDVLFSERQAFMAMLRPGVGDDKTPHGQMAYLDAFFHITPQQVLFAKNAAQCKELVDSLMADDRNRNPA